MSTMQPLIDVQKNHADLHVYRLPSGWQWNDALPDLVTLTSEPFIRHSEVIEAEVRDGGVLVLNWQNDVFFVVPDQSSDVQLTQARMLTQTTGRLIRAMQDTIPPMSDTIAADLTGAVLGVLLDLSTDDFNRLKAAWTRPHTESAA